MSAAPQVRRGGDDVAGADDVAHDLRRVLGRDAAAVGQHATDGAHGRSAPAARCLSWLSSRRISASVGLCESLRGSGGGRRRADGLLARGHTGLRLDGLRMRARKRGPRVAVDGRRGGDAGPGLLPAGSAVAVTAAARTRTASRTPAISARRTKRVTLRRAVAIRPLTPGLIDRARRRLSPSHFSDRQNGRMHFDLTDEQQRSAASCATSPSGEVAPVAEELDRDEALPVRDRREARRARADGHPLPEEYGGGGADNLSYALAIEELARVDSSVAITLARTPRSAPGRSTRSGREEQKERVDAAS